MINITTTAVTKTLNSSLNNNVAPIVIPNILLIVIGFLSVLLNGVLLIAIFRNASVIFKENGAYLVANVAVADLFTGVFSLVYSITSHTQITMSEEGSAVLVALFWTSVETSLTTVFVMSLKRYIAVMYPFKGEAWLSKKNAIYSCIAVWIFSWICGIFMALYQRIMTFCLAIFFEITTLATIFLYYKIFTKLGQQRQGLPLVKSTSARRMDKGLQREYQLTTVVVVLTIIMIVTVLPHMIGGQIYLSYQLFTSNQHPANVVLFVTYYLPIELTNFVLNPVVYAWRLPKYRFALLRTLKCR